MDSVLLKFTNYIKLFIKILIQNLMSSKASKYIDFPFNQLSKKNGGILKFKDHKYDYSINPQKTQLDLINFFNTEASKELKNSNITYEVNKIIKISNSHEIISENETYSNLSSILDAKIEFKINNETFKTEIKPGSLYNISLKKNENIKINSNKQLCFSQSFVNKQKENTVKKNNIIIFIDGLIGEIVNNKEKFQNLLPNTYDYFKDGTIFSNHYSNGEWSLPSAANFFSGCYTDKHKLFHNEKNHQINSKLKLLGEVFSENDYYTFMINGSWRMVPNYGFIKGIDKYIYKKNMSAVETINHFINIDSRIKNSKKFYWLTFFDLHGVGLKNEFGGNFFINKKKSLKSVHQKFNDALQKEYYFGCSLLDTKLSCLYNYIKTNYEHKEVNISIITDHGQSFFDSEKDVLKDNRIKVPWLIKSKNIPPGIQNYFSENVDLYPTLLKINNIDYDVKTIDGGLPISLGGKSKNFSKSQSIYPNHPYLLRVDSINNVYKFESEQKLRENMTWDDLKQKKLTIKSKQENYIEDKNETKEAERLYDFSCKRFLDQI